MAGRADGDRLGLRLDGRRVRRRRLRVRDLHERRQHLVEPDERSERHRLDPGTTLVRFAAVDGVGIASTWTQVTVKLDLTVPLAPTISGGSSTWANAASGAVTDSLNTKSALGVAVDRQPES